MDRARASEARGREFDPPQPRHSFLLHYWCFVPTLFGWRGKSPGKMTRMIPFQYGSFYDVPRAILIHFQARWLLLQSEFDETLDEYESEYSVYLLPASFEPPENGDTWRFVDQFELTCIAKIPVNELQFDTTKRKTLDEKILWRVMKP